jgi:hypothetical protein
VLGALSKSALVFIGYNAVFGVLRAGTDLAAHAGGLIAGFLCGLVQSMPLTVDRTRSRYVRNAVVALGAAAVIIGTAFAFPRPVDLRAKLQNFASVEKKSLATYNAILTDARRGRLRDEQMAEEVEKQILPDWVSAQRSLSGLTGLPARQQRLVSSIVQYMEVRRQGWTTLAEGLRRHDAAMVRLAGAKQAEAGRLAKELIAPPQ